MVNLPAVQVDHLHAIQHPGHVLPAAPVAVQVPGRGIQYYYPAAAAAQPNSALPKPFPGGQPIANGPPSPFSPTFTPPGHQAAGQHGHGFRNPWESGATGRSEVSRWREFKISGQIGSPGQKDKLTYSALSFQIVNAVQRGFAEADICAAIIKAIVPGEDLRTYLEMRPDLTLDKVIPILRAHFKEKDATSVFNELSNGAQKAGESENDFCLRMMGLRQKVLLMSKEEKSQYSEDLVQNQFQKSLGTGFRREAVRQQLRAILKEPIEDLRLLQEISDVVMTETEHDTKLGTKGAGNSVNQVEDRSKANEKKGSNAQQKPGNPIISEITKLAGEVEKIKQELGNVLGEGAGAMGHSNVLQNVPAGVAGNGAVSSQGGRGQGQGMAGVAGNGIGGGQRGRGRGRGGRNGGLGPSRGPNGRLGCADCQANGLLCRHCFHCGGVGHRFFECSENQKNDPGSQE